METLKVLHVGRFTIAQVKDTETGLKGVGLARKSDWDKFNDNLAEKIAIGRAQNAIEMKKRREPIRQLLMG